MYKVLWFDDEHTRLESIKEDFLLNDIQLMGYSNAREGLEALKEEKFVDAIILDGMFFKTPEQTGDVNDSAFGEVAVALGNMKARGIIIPWFIYSGQKNFVKDKNKLVDLLKDQAYADGKVFDKNLDEDFRELCEVIKREADKQPRTKARLNNPELMEIFELGYLPDSVEDLVLDLLIKPLPKSNTELKEILTIIRSIHESCFVPLKNIRVLDSSLNTFSSKINHLSGNPNPENDWNPRSMVYQTREIADLQKWVYYTAANYDHYLEEQHYDGYMISKYAVEALRSGLFEILLWFKKTYEENI